MYGRGPKTIQRSSRCREGKKEVFCDALGDRRAFKKFTKMGPAGKGKVPFGGGAGKLILRENRKGHTHID